MRAPDRERKNAQTRVRAKRPENARTRARAQGLRVDPQLELMRIGLHKKMNAQRDRPLERKATRVQGEARGSECVRCQACDAQLSQ